LLLNCRPSSALTLPAPGRVLAQVKVDEVDVEVGEVDRVVGLAGDVEPAVAVEGDAGELAGAGGTSIVWTKA
jgi:hypothetical protein